MSKLTDTQSIILSTAAQRADGNVLPLPGSLRGGAATKVVGALLSRGLIREHVLDSPRKADPALNTVWRNLEDGRGVLLLITDAGLEAIGIEPERAPETADEAQPGPAAPEAAEAPATVPTRRTVRAGTKQAQLIAMLEAPEGASIAEITAATGWRSHTVRGAIAGALKKRLGLNVTSEKLEGRGTVYRLA